MYLDESAPGYVDREEPSLAEGIERIRLAGGISSLAHPIRLGKRDPAKRKSSSPDSSRWDWIRSKPIIPITSLRMSAAILGTPRNIIWT